MKRKLKILIFLTLTIFLLLPPTKVQAQPTNKYLNIEGLKNLYLRGDQINFTVYTNADQFNLQIYLPSGELWLNKTYEANSTLNFQIPNNAPFGFYKVKASTNWATTTKYFTLLDTSNWEPVTFPYTVNHKGVTYTFYSNGTFTAEGQDGSLKLDFSTLVKLIKLLDLTVTARKNSMCLKITLTKTSLNLKVDLIWAFVYKGCKFAIRGTIDRPRTLVWKMSKFANLKRLATGIRLGHLVFDWSDILSAGYSCRYNKILNALEISVGKTFVLDPYIFEDGFESGDFSAWDGTFVTSNDTLEVISTDSYEGSYCMNCSVDSIVNDGAYCYKSITTQSVCHARAYVKVMASNIEPDGYVYFIQFRYAGYGRTVARVGRSGNGSLRLAYRDGGSNYYKISSTTLSLQSWHCLELRFVHSDTSGEYKVYLDGVEVTDLTVTSANTSDVYVDRVRFGIAGGYSWPDGGVTVQVDSAVINDDYIGPSNTAPNIPLIQTPTTTYANQYFDLNCTVSDTDGANDVENVTINLGNGVVLKWENDTNTFSESQDTNNRCTLNTSACMKTNINSTTFKLTFNLKLNNYPTGAVNVTGIAYDSTGASGTKTENSLFTLSYPTLTLQAQDADGNNLPIVVTFKGTLGNGSSFTTSSNSNGFKQLVTCYGTHTINIWWGTHLIGSTTTSVTTSKTVNINTKIRKATYESHYLLASLNNTNLPVPTVISGTEVKFAGVTASGTIQFRLDVSHWHVQDEPVKIQVGDYIYERGATGWSWDSINKIWSFNIHFSTQDITIYWEEQSSSGSSGGSTPPPPETDVPGEPVEEPSPPSVPAQPVPESYVIYQQPSFTVDTTMVAVGLIVIAAVVYVANYYLNNYGSVSKLWRKKLQRKRKVKWKK